MPNPAQSPSAQSPSRSEASVNHVDADGGRTITKADLIEAVYEKVGFSKKESSEIVEKILETMKVTLEKGQKLKISGFGKFEVRHKNTRRGRNPQTNMELQIPAHRVVSFKPSQVLKAAIAGESTAGMTDDLD
jgi:integration host factor subunit alpha